MTAAQTLLFLAVPLTLFIGIALYLMFFGKPRYQEEEGREKREAWMKQKGWVRTEGENVVTAGLALLKELYKNSHYAVIEQYTKAGDARLGIGYIASSGTAPDSQYSYETVIFWRLPSPLPAFALYHLPELTGIAGKLLKRATGASAPGNMLKCQLHNEMLDRRFTLYTASADQQIRIDEELLKLLSGRGYFIMHGRGDLIAARAFTFPPAVTNFEQETSQLIDLAEELLTRGQPVLLAKSVAVDDAP